MLVGLFDVLDQERGSVMAGLDRFGKRQKELAAELREDNEKLRTCRRSRVRSESGGTDDTASKVGGRGVSGSRQALSYACDVPTKIEQRLFALAIRSSRNWSDHRSPRACHRLTRLGRKTFRCPAVGAVADTTQHWVTEGHGPFRRVPRHPAIFEADRTPACGLNLPAEPARPCVKLPSMTGGRTP